MIEIDYEVAALIALWTVAFVAGVRARIPKIDGWLVIPTAFIGSALCSLILLYPPIPPWVRYAVLGLIGAVGGVSFKDRIISKVRSGNPPEKEQ